MLKKAPTAFIATVLLGTTPALAIERSDHPSTVESASVLVASGTVHDHVVAQAQNMGNGHGSTGGMGSGMSHDKMMEQSAEGGAASGHVMGHGVVNSVNKTDGTVNLSHEPISALGWPSMTMDMKVSGDVDLSKVQVGKPIDFTMSRGADGIYLVDLIKGQ